MVDWDFRQAIEIHDQGGEAVIETDETPSRRIRLKLRELTGLTATAAHP